MNVLHFLLEIGIKREKLLPLNSEEVSGKVVDTLEDNAMLQHYFYSVFMCLFFQLRGFCEAEMSHPKVFECVCHLFITSSPIKKKDRFVILTLESAFKDHHLYCQPMTDCCEFRFLVGADLLPSVGFKTNFMVKRSDGRI